ncbi:MAG TPA: ABC transporter permease [Conexibacter sp.]|nr:ABC transporter permease [Conexibacter sp.]
MSARRPPWPLAAVGVALLAFLYLPIMVVVLYAFNGGRNLTWPPEGLSLRWFRAMLDDPGFSAAFGTSLKVALISTLIATVAAVMAAIAFTRSRWWVTRAIESLARLPIMVPPVLIGVALLTTIAAANVRLSTATVVTGHVVLIIPYVIVVVLARLRTFDLRLEQAARDLGARPPVVLGRVTLPIIAPAVLGGALLAFGLSFDEIYVTSFTAGSDPTLPLFVLSKLRRIVDPTINAVATVMLVIPWIALGLSALIMGRSLRPRRGEADDN